MERIILLFAMMLTIAAQAQNHDWENPRVLGINKLPYHATLQLPSKWKDCKEIFLPYLCTVKSKKVKSVNSQIVK